MSEYGADADPDLDKAFDFQETKSMLPGDKVNVMQWTYPGYRVQKIAKKHGKSNLLIKYDL